MNTWNIFESPETFEAQAVRTPTTRQEQSEYFLLTAELPPVQLKQIIFEPATPDIGFIVSEILPEGTGYRINVVPYVREFVTKWTGLDEFGRYTSDDGAVTAPSKASAIGQTQGLLKKRGYTQLTVSC